MCFSKMFINLLDDTKIKIKLEIAYSTNTDQLKLQNQSSCILHMFKKNHNLPRGYKNKYPI